MACFRELSMLRFTSFSGVACTMILMMVLLSELGFDGKVCENPVQQFSEADYFNFDGENIVIAIPFIIFCFMYQPNVPQTYSELKVKTPAQMTKVLLSANVVAVAVYMIVGTTGYLIFADRAKEQLQDPSRSTNILEADFEGSWLIQASRYLIMVAVIAAAPLAVLPAKYAYEQMYHRSGMTDAQNTVCSVSMVILCFFLAVIMPNVGTVIGVTGATANPFVGFIFPILFYLKIDRSPMSSGPKLRAQLMLFLCILVSVLGLAKLHAELQSAPVAEEAE